MKIGRIGRSLIELVPKTRISICTYRDLPDPIVVQGLSLTNDIDEIESFLSPIYPQGGGVDIPEAVHRGLQWPLDNNKFRPKAYKVILVFGDAPPHRRFLPTCIELAETFRRKQNGKVGTVTCRSRRRLPEFMMIAKAGGGEAMLAAHEREIMKQLVIMVFGSRHRAEVLRVLRLD